MRAAFCERARESTPQLLSHKELRSCSANERNLSSPIFARVRVSSRLLLPLRLYICYMFVCATWRQRLGRLYSSESALESYFITICCIKTATFFRVRSWNFPLSCSIETGRAFDFCIINARVQNVVFELFNVVDKSFRIIGFSILYFSCKSRSESLLDHLHIYRCL